MCSITHSAALTRVLLWLLCMQFKDGDWVWQPVRAPIALMIVRFDHFSSLRPFCSVRTWYISCNPIVGSDDAVYGIPTFCLYVIIKLNTVWHESNLSPLLCLGSPEGVVTESYVAAGLDSAGWCSADKGRLWWQETQDQVTVQLPRERMQFSMSLRVEEKFEVLCSLLYSVFLITFPIFW